MPYSTFPKFNHGEIGLTRFPPNVEQVTIRREFSAIWLVVRRNDASDCRYLADLLMSGVSATSESAVLVA
jgi:hypothetical protein